MVAPIKVYADDPELKDAPMIVSQDDPDLQDVPAPIKVSADDPELKPVGDHISLIDAIDQNTGGIVGGAINNIKGMPSNLAAAGKGALGDIASMSVRAIEFANNPFKGLSQRPDDLAAYADEVNRATAQIEQEAAQQDVAAGRSEFFGKTMRGVTRSLATAAPMGMALGPFGAIGGATLIQGGQAATEALDAGIPEGERARFVAEQMMWEGLPATLMQRIGLGGLESQLGTLANPAKRGISAALKQFGVSSLQELPEEYVTALGQAVSRVASGVGKPEEIGPDGIYNLMRDVTAQTLGTTGLVSAAGYRPASQAPAAPAAQPSPTTPSPTPATQATAAQPEPQYAQTYEQEFGDVWADLAQETPQAQPAPTPSPDAEVAPQATVAPTATPSETPEQFAERIDAAGQMEEADFAYYRENQAAVDEALRQMYDQYAEVDAVDEGTQQPAESEVIPSEEKGQEAEVLTEPQAVATPEPPAPQQSELMPEPAPEPTLETSTQPASNLVIPALHYSRTPMSLVKGVDISKMEGAYSAYEESTFGPGFYAMEPSDETMWKDMGRFSLGQYRNEIQITPKNPLIIDPKAVRERGFDALVKAVKSGKHDAIISRGWGDADMRMPIHKRTRELWKPKFPPGKTEGKFINADEFEKAHNQAIREITGLEPSEYKKVTKSDWDQNQIFIPADFAPDIVSGLKGTKDASGAVESPSTKAVPIRFKRSGKGDTAVHEASIEGRAVTISKGKDGWEVRLDGQVADVHPTMKAARDYATGELRQDLRDQANAEDEEMGANLDIQRDQEFDNRNVFERDEISVGKPRAVKNFMEAPVEAPAPTLSSASTDTGTSTTPSQQAEQTKTTAWERFKSNKKREKDARASEQKARFQVAQKRAPADYVERIRPDVKKMLESWGSQQTDLITRAAGQRLTIDQMTDVVIEWMQINQEMGEPALFSDFSFLSPSQYYFLNPALKNLGLPVASPTGPGPAPADTGIFRDLTAAAREGKRFVEALYHRIQPVLARIHAEAKSAVDFVRRAVAKIGEHIKPYARRFLADVRAVNKEFRQNPTRGSVPTPEMSKRGKATGEALGAGAPKLPKGMEPDAQTRQAGVVQGYKEGVLRQQQDTRAMLDIARQVLPAKEWRAIAKAAMSISRMRNSTESGKRRALDRVLSKHLTEIRRGQALSKTQKTIKAIKQKFNKLRPEVQDAVTDIFKGFREKNITEATYNKALSVLARGTSGKDTVTPKELARAAKIIESFEGDDKPELLRNLSQQELESINDVLESLMEKNDAMNAGIVAEMERQKLANNTLAVEEVKARGPVTLKNLAFENKVFRSIGDTILNLPNIVRGIATKSGHVYKTLVSDLVEADTKTQAMLLKHSRIIQRAVAEAGITPDQIRSMSAIDNNKAEEVEVAGVKMTKGERISLLLHLSDPDTRAILMNPKSLGFKFSRAESGANRRLKITPEVAEEIENSATPEELKLARIFFDWSNGEVMNDVNEWSTRVFGYKMFRNDQHWNRRRTITDKEPAIGLQADGTQAQQEATGYLKERTGGTSYIIVDDAFQHVASHMNAIAALIGKFEASVNARRLLGTSEFQDAVAENRRTGGKILQELNKRINEWGAISNPRPEAGMRFVRWAGRNYTASKLATNFSVIISQPFSVLSAAKVIPSKYIAKTFTATPMDVNALAEIEATPEAADLYYIVHGGGQHIVTPGSMAGATMGDIFKTAEKPFTDKMMTFVERGNDMAVFNIWRAAKAWGQDQGLSGDELMRFTAKTARDAWLQTQPSHSSVYHSGIKLRSRSSPTAYALSMFQGQTAIQFQDAIDSVRDYQELPDNQKTAAERAKVMAKFARPIILQAAMFEALKYAGSEAWDWIFGKSDAKKARDKKIDPALDKFIEVVKSPVSSMPGFGPILDTSIEVYKRMALGMPRIDAISNPILSSAEDVALAPAAAIKILNRLKDGKEPRLTDARALARGVDVLSGVPTGNFVEWVSALSSMLMR